MALAGWPGEWKAQAEVVAIVGSFACKRTLMATSAVGLLCVLAAALAWTSPASAGGETASPKSGWVQVADARTDAADRFFLKAIKLFRSGDLSGAVAQFELGLSIDPDNPIAHYHFAETYAAMKRDSDALKHYEKAVELGPDTTEGVMAAAMLAAQEAIDLDANKETRGALAGKHFQDAIEETDNERAVALYSKAIKLRPDLGLYFLERGNAYNKLGDYDRAIRDFGQAIRLVPDYALAYHNRSYAYGSLGDYDRAIRDSDQAIRIYPGYAKAFFNRGGAYYAKGDYDRAIRDYDQAIRLDPDYADAFYNRGNTYTDKGSYDRAITDYDEAIQLNPDYADAFNNRGNAYRKKGEYDRAIADYDQAIRLTPALAVAFSNRGNAYGDKGEYDRAIQDYDQAVKLDPDNAVAIQNRAVTLEMQNQ